MNWNLAVRASTCALLGSLLAVGGAQAQQAQQGQQTQQTQPSQQPQNQPSSTNAQGEAVQPWGLPPLPPGVGPIEQFADIHDTPQGNFLEGGSFDTNGNFWFVAIGSG